MARTGYFAVNSAKFSGIFNLLRGCGKLIGASLAAMPHSPLGTTTQSLLADGTWKKVSKETNPKGAYLSRVDLEHDLTEEMESEVIAYACKKLRKRTLDAAIAIKYLQGKKAIRMRELLAQISDSLPLIKGGNLAKPLLHAKTLAEG